ncbi:MAG TPA: hemerythrin domain-containing protein [Chitinophagaceae bacterium]|nr:hemerythrin domain-containing protein [Chitinophagaceae bacterium]
MADAKMPVNRSPQLAPLSREHHEGLLLVWKIFQGLKNNVDIDRIRKYVLWYWQSHIRPHFYQEEKILLPYLPPNHELARRLQREHEQIREMILNLDQEADKNLFTALAKFLDDHIRFEERDLFGYLEQVLSKDQLDVISIKLKEHPLPDSEWKDEFWIKAK